MLEDILIGITQALDAEFKNMNIYTDDIEQGLDTPCFLVTDLISTEEQELGNRYNRSYPFMIQYFPQDKKYRIECGRVKDRLFNCLEYIMVAGDTTRGTEMSGRVDDSNGILNFEVTYDVQIMKVCKDESEVMESLAMSQTVKE